MKKAVASAERDIPKSLVWGVVLRKWVMRLRVLLGRGVGLKIWVDGRLVELGLVLRFSLREREREREREKFSHVSKPLSYA
jgi:hypothetical protein